MESMEERKNNSEILNWYLAEAKNNGYALGHFNFSTADVLRGIVQAAQETGAPAIMVGTSEGESSFIGLNEAVVLVKAMREEYNFPIFLNADHFKSFEKCKEAIDTGYDSVIMDASKMEFAVNITETKKVVEYTVSTGRNVLIEGEIGYLRGSSEVQTKVAITPDDFTKPEEVKEFIEKTGVNQLAVVFGNIHGIVTDQEEKLDVKHLKKIISAAPDVFYVLHGASGLSDEDVKAAINAGVTNVHFNTELRIAYKEGLHQVFHDKPRETTPYKYLAPAVEEVKRVVSQKIKLFMGK